MVPIYAELLFGYYPELGLTTLQSRLPIFLLYCPYLFVPLFILFLCVFKQEPFETSKEKGN
jgi:hypothetical protein